jgi:hypothetical protein
MAFNGMIRRRLGMTPSIEDSRGLGLAARAGLGFAARRMKLLPKAGMPAPAAEMASPDAQARLAR